LGRTCYHLEINPISAFVDAANIFAFLKLYTFAVN
jgi:hypothetical protein